MQKATIMIVTSGTLIVVGLILLALGNQIILDGISQGEQKVTVDQPLVISLIFDSQQTQTGIFAVQTIEFKEGVLSVKVLDPLDTQIISQRINEESIEKQIEIRESGMYKLIIDSTSDEEIHVFGAIGPLPDANKKLPSLISIYIVIIGMIGMLVFGIHTIRNKKRSV